jgi:hypothetical protein
MALLSHVKKLRFLLLLIAISLAPAFSFYQQAPQQSSLKSYDINAKMKGLFIYNFARYIKWPEHMGSGDFIIGILGDYESLFQELKIMSQKKKAGDQSFVVEKYNSLDQIKRSHILYIVSENSDHLPQVIKKMEDNDYNTLILTEKEGLASKGAGINFYYSESKQRMEINPDNVTKYGLTLSKQLMTVARVVKDDK